MNKTIFKNETIYFFSVDHDSIEKEDIPNIQQQLMVKNDLE